jgi:pyruvate,water dikinase
MKYVIHLEDEAAMASRRVGQKFAVLAKAHHHGFPVPMAFAISTDAHQIFLQSGHWPSGLSDEVEAAAEVLGLEKGLSIRSSATREDLENQSFAGQYRTFLEVCQPAELKEKIQQCWMSADTDHVRSYLESTSTSNGSETPLMGIIIQRMVQAQVSGVAFGCNPMRPDSREVVIEAVTGLADKLVNGHTTPCRGIVSENGSLTFDSLSTQPHACEKADQPLLKKAMWLEIAEAARRLEKLNGQTPQDIEWAMDSDQNLWLLQARAITTLPAKRVTDLTGIWTRKIANDLWADRLSPFLADIMKKTAPQWNLSRVCRWIGIPVVEPSVVVINGYLYLNCASIRASISALPVRLRLNFLDSLLPPEASIADLPVPSLRETFSRFMRILPLPLLEPGSVPLLTPWLTRRHMRATRRRLDAIDRMDGATAAEGHRKLRSVLAELTRIQVKNQWPYAYATALTWLLRWLLTEQLERTHADFLELVGRGGDNVSLQIENRLRSIAERIHASPAVAAAVRRSLPEDMMVHLPQGLVKDIEAFIDRFGCRSRHRSLYVKRWAEDPGEVLSILHKLVQHHQPSNPPVQPKHAGISIPLWLRPLVRITTNFLDLREDLRFLLDHCLFRLRTSLRRIGDLTGLGDLVFYLTPAELEEYVQGTEEKAVLKKTAGQRREAFLNPSEASTFIVDGYPADEFPPEDRILRGLGSSPGQVVGCARVVEDPTRAIFEKGDILIAKNTDPGWTPILSIVGGMVMEEGGLLNHCSIVARELGIPSIVGVEHATRRIMDGATVHLDGGRGIVRIEDKGMDSI